MSNDEESSFKFLNLLPEIKRIILKKLNLSSRYNVIFVWEDMADEFWKTIDVDKKFCCIHNLKDLEYAGVLASAGYIKKVENLGLRQSG